MGFLPKVIGSVCCGILLSVGLSTIAQAELFTPRQGVQGIQSPVGQTIQGEVLRIEGDDCILKAQDGKEVRLQIDHPLLKAANIKPGDRIEATVNEQNHVLSFRPSGHGAP